MANNKRQADENAEAGPSKRPKIEKTTTQNNKRHTDENAEAGPSKKPKAEKTTTQNIICPDCGGEYNPAERSRHVMSLRHRHAGRGEGLYRCPGCDTRLTRLDAFKRHVNPKYKTNKAKVETKRKATSKSKANSTAKSQPKSKTSRKTNSKRQECDWVVKYRDTQDPKYLVPDILPLSVDKKEFSTGKISDGVLETGSPVLSADTTSDSFGSAVTASSSTKSLTLYAHIENAEEEVNDFVIEEDGGRQRESSSTATGTATSIFDSSLMLSSSISTPSESHPQAFPQISEEELAALESQLIDYDG